MNNKKLFFAVAAIAGSAQAYYSGEIRTREPFRYGKFRTRMQGSGQRGTVASLFTFWNGQDDLPWSVAEWEEIDIELVPTQGEQTFYTNLIYANRAMDGQSIQFDPATNWHEYEIIWKPDYIAWTIDGQEVRRQSGTYSVTDMDKFQHLFMNFWTPTWEGWGGGLDDTQMPFYTSYDYVEAYDWDQAADTFVMRFRDDFDTLDETIWLVSDDWGFPDNSSRFMYNHTYVVDGKLVLKLDTTYGDLQPNPPAPEPQPEPTPEPQPEPTPEPQPEPTPEPTPEPETCDQEAINLDAQARIYGDPCGRKDDQSTCGSGCDACHKSWPAYDPNGWDSAEAQCQCLPTQLGGDQYEYGPLSRDDKAGACGRNCNECRWSWPKSDALKWKSDLLMARCMPPDEIPFDASAQDQGQDGGSDPVVVEDVYADWVREAGITFGGPCENLYDQTCGDSCLQCLWSYPTGDPDTWWADAAMCRCQEKKTLVWGDVCGTLTDGLCGLYCTECRQATFLDDPASESTCRCKSW